MKLNDLRKQIEDIDQEMLDLFLKRMDVSAKIGAYKKEHQLPILDENREHELLEKQKALLNNETLWPLYRKFLIEVMKLSKEYQKLC
ncbi:MAG: chorismate mutase [Acholeplasmataceae bacterium]